MKSWTLVTGGAGCIGSDLVDGLLQRGDSIVALDNLSSGKLEHIAAFHDNPRFRFVEGDLFDPAAIDDALDGVNMVYHLAAYPDVKFAEGDSTDKDLRQNTMGTYNVLEGMRRRGIAKLAFASTSAIYGISDRLPIAENDAARPISLYGATKLGCEAMISAFQHLFRMQCWIFRFANIVGPKVRKTGGTVISDFIDKLNQNPNYLEILGNGKQAKSYLLASECVDAMDFAVEQAREDLNTYNIGCNDSLAVDRIAEMVVQGMGLSRVEFRHTGGEGGWPGDVPRFLLDVRAINRLGWKAKHNSEQAVRIAIESTLEAIGRPLCRQ